MYLPDMFAASGPEETLRIIEAHPFGTLISHSDAGLAATHVPLLARTDGTTITHLECHFARPNTHWKSINGEVLAIFQGHEHYITPSWYPTKAETGKVVPTWNYETVHVHGTARAIADADWLLRHVSDVTDRFEAAREMPWSTDDAPEDFMKVMVRGIVGIEITVTNVETKIKASQNRPVADRQGVADGLKQEPGPAARAMAELVEAYKDVQK